MSSILRKWITIIEIVPTSYTTVYTQYGNSEVTARIKPGLSYNNNLQAALVAHKAAALADVSLDAKNITSSQIGGWLARDVVASVTSGVVALSVPASNAGKVLFKLAPTIATAQYSLNGGTFTSFVEGSQIVVGNGNTLQVRGLNISRLQPIFGSLWDVQTDQRVDYIHLTNNL